MYFSRLSIASYRGDSSRGRNTTSTTRESAYRYASASRRCNLSVSTSKSADEPPAAYDVVQTYSMPELYSSVAEISTPLSASSGDGHSRCASPGTLEFFRDIRRTQSYQERERRSRERAASLSELWELAERRDDALIKMSDTAVKNKVTHYTGTPSFNTCSSKDAADRFDAQREEAEKNGYKVSSDPLLTPSERAWKEKKELYKQRKQAQRGTSSVTKLQTSVAELQQGVTSAALLGVGDDARKRIQRSRHISTQQKKQQVPSKLEADVGDNDDDEYSPRSVATKNTADFGSFAALAGFAGVAVPHPASPRTKWVHDPWTTAETLPNIMQDC